MFSSNRPGHNEPGPVASHFYDRTSLEAVRKNLNVPAPESLHDRKGIVSTVSAAWRSLFLPYTADSLTSDTMREALERFDCLGLALLSGRLVADDLTFISTAATNLKELFPRGYLGLTTTLSLLKHVTAVEKIDPHSIVELVDGFCVGSCLERAFALRHFAVHLDDLQTRDLLGSDTFVWQATVISCRAMQRLNDFSRVPYFFQKCAMLVSPELHEHLFAPIQQIAASCESISELGFALDHLCAVCAARDLIGAGPRSGSTAEFFYATGGLPVGIWVRREIMKSGRQIIRNQRSLFDIFEGFGSDTFMARRPPLAKARALYEQFGRDIGRMRIIHHTDREGYPGPGFIIDRVDQQRALRAHYDSARRDPIRTYRDIWPAVASVLDDVAEARFVIARACIAITGSATPRYMIAPADGLPPISYSLVVCNVNHGNDGNDIACLVPTAVLDKKLQNRSVQIAPEMELPDPLLDMNQAGLRINELRGAAHALGYPLIAVGSPAALTGHYEYTIDSAYAPAPLPLSRATGRSDGRSLDQERRSESIYGHTLVHTGDQQPEMLIDVSRDDLPVSDLHNQIASTTDALIKLWQGVRFIRANWTKGNTGGEQLDVQYDQEELDDRLHAQGLPLYWNCNCVRMLVEACAWNRARADASDDPVRFPVLTLGDSRRYSSAPPAEAPYLDTFSGVGGDAGMTFGDGRGGRQTIHFPEGGRSLEDAIFFIENFLQKATSDTVELRFYDRRSVFGE